MILSSQSTVTVLGQISSAAYYQTAFFTHTMELKNSTKHASTATLTFTVEKLSCLFISK